ncbi:MAG: hypothetical protein KA175_02490 [Flavobacteriales bacterium]|nr:hypothetical protein [Flavobacteriales bacterium]MBP6696457.1 hypothetical protein [Flavobacteriales bacterium]
MAATSLNGAALITELLLFASCGEPAAEASAGEDPILHPSWADSVMSAYHMRSAAASAFNAVMW